MKSETVLTKNVARLAAAGTELIKRAPGMPGIGLIHGPTGYGKSRAVDWYANKCNAVYVRAMSMWTPASMLGKISAELRLPVTGSCAQMLDRIIEKLAFSQRPLFVDEADYIVDSKRMTECLRDLHDMAIVPVVLIGMDEIEEKLAARKQFTRRVMQSVQFHPLDFVDARKIADALCEVAVADDLLRKMLADTNGACGNLVVSLAGAEQLAKSRGQKTVALEDVGPKKLFTGPAPAAAPISVAA